MEMRNLRIVILLFLLSAVSCQLSAVSWAQKSARKLNIISGQVSAINKDFIAVVYRADEAKGSEEEIGLPLAKDLTVEHKQGISEIAVGDMVDVEYEEYSEETANGSQSKRVAVAVRFLRAALKQPEPLTFGAEKEETEE